MQVRPIAVLIPSRFDEHIYRLMSSIQGKKPYKIVVLDDGLKRPPSGSIRCPRPFNFSRNINLGLRSYPGHDFVFLNDDTLCKTSDSFNIMQSVANEHNIGILSSKIKGHARNSLQLTSRKTEEPMIINEMVAFIAVFVRWPTIKALGGMDERFIHYGWEDDDYCLRARIAGFSIGITNKVIFEHIHGSGSSFKKVFKGGYGPGNAILFRRKWGFINANQALRRLNQCHRRRVQVCIPLKM